MTVMQKNIAQFEERKNILEQYASRADSDWQDEVKQEFFSCHLKPLRQSFSNQINAMAAIAGLIEQAESEIRSMM